MDICGTVEYRPAHDGTLTKGEFRDDKIRRKKQFKLEEETQQRPVRY